MSPGPDAVPPSASSPRPRRQALLVALAIGAVASLIALAGGVLGPHPERPGVAALPGGSRPGRTAPADIIDVHVHVSPKGVPRLLDLMRAHGIRAAVNLSGGDPLSGLDTQLAAAARAPDRVIVFTTLAYEQAQFPDYGARMARLVRIAHARGARGLKIAKILGLGLTTRQGTRIPVDDPGLDPVFEAAGELGMPVAIHTGDPEAFWLPVDERNPRRAELQVHPGWALYGRPVPSFDELLAELERRIARHPRTTFISVHFGNAAERPPYVARLLRTYPNLFIDTAARIPELGRHRADEMRAFFIEFQDRILFGSDLGVGPAPSPLFLGSSGAEPPRAEDERRFFEASRLYFESDERQFAHPTPIQGDWKIDGIALPPAVLAKIYHENAERVLGVR